MPHDDELEQVRGKLSASFATGGARYADLRPGYPDAVIAWITEGIVTGADVADVGAGTGKLTEGLVRAGYAPIAVDPSADMLAQLTTRMPDIRTVVGRGEATTLPGSSLDLVTFAQSWHWVPPAAGAAELARVLRPGGRVAMVWNSFDERVDWLVALSGVWHTTDGAEVIHRSRGRAPDLGMSFSPPESVLIDWVQRTTPYALAQLVTTRSYYLTAPPDEQRRILAASTALVAERFGDAEQIDVPHRTAAYRATRRPSG